MGTAGRLAALLGFLLVGASFVLQLLVRREDAC